MTKNSNSKMKKLIQYFFILILIVFSLLTFPGCQSTDKKESFVDTTSFSYSKFEYDSVENKTKIIWATTLSNNTIYNFNSFSITFKLFYNNELIETETYNYDIAVNHGKEYTGAFNFYYDGKIDSIEYVSWSANYNSFWDTYNIWFIVAIVAVVAISIAYISIMIIQDLELDDIGDFISENSWILFSLLIPFGSSIYAFIESSWVSALIILGALIAVILIGLIAHLIKYIIQEADFSSISFGRNTCSTDDCFDEDIGDIEDCIDSPDELQHFSVNELKNYCREQGIKGFSSLNKGAIIDLIISFDKDENKHTAISNSKNKSLNQKHITFDDIAGLEEAKNAFKEKVVFAFEHKDLYEKYEKKVGGGLLLYGLPGTGKTMFAEAASNETDALFIPIKCSDIKSKWYGESENNVKNIFTKARKAKKAIIFFDEFEAIGAKRTDNSDNGNNDLVPQILAEMQGVNSSKSDNIIMVIAATNKPWAIDSAFLRPGRFDEKIYIPLPDFVARKRLFELKINAIPQQELDYNYLAEISNGFNGADIGEFCDKLKMVAINRAIKNNIESPITMEDVEEIKKIVKSSVSDEDIERLEDFMK